MAVNEELSKAKLKLEKLCPPPCTEPSPLPCAMKASLNKKRETCLEARRFTLRSIFRQGEKDRGAWATGGENLRAGESAQGREDVRLLL